MAGNEQKNQRAKTTLLTKKLSLAGGINSPAIPPTNKIGLDLSVS
jgi:hypothetical protein